MWQSPESLGKRVELTKEFVPGLKRVALIFAENDVIESNLVTQAMQHLGVNVRPHPVRDAQSVEAALLEVTRERPQFIMVLVSAFTITHRNRLASFAVKARILS